VNPDPRQSDASACIGSPHGEDGFVDRRQPTGRPRERDDLARIETFHALPHLIDARGHDPRSHPRLSASPEASMFARVFVTIVLIAMAIGAFWIDALGAGSHINPFGVLFWFLAIVNWYAWGAMREGWSYGREVMNKDGTNLPLLARFGPVYIKGIANLWRTAHPGRTGSDGSDH
jgi:hypothetical protein